MFPSETQSGTDIQVLCSLKYAPTFFFPTCGKKKVRARAKKKGRLSFRRNGLLPTSPGCMLPPAYLLKHCTPQDALTVAIAITKCPQLKLGTGAGQGGDPWGTIGSPSVALGIGGSKGERGIETPFPLCGLCTL